MCQEEGGLSRGQRTGLEVVVGEVAEKVLRRVNTDLTPGGGP